MKGAYEVIINRCTKYLDGHERIIIDKNKLLEKLKVLACDYRIIGLCYSSNNSFVLIGFVLLKDNVRKEAYGAIKNISESGVQVVMVTGDALDTAISVARELNIINSSDDLVLTSEELIN